MNMTELRVRVAALDAALGHFLDAHAAEAPTRASVRKQLGSGATGGDHVRELHEAGLRHGARHAAACRETLQPLAYRTVEFARAVLGRDDDRIRPLAKAVAYADLTDSGAARLRDAVRAFAERIA